MGGEDRHLYQVKLNPPVAGDARNNFLEACVIPAVFANHELHPNQLIFISIHFSYSFLRSSCQGCKE